MEIRSERSAREGRSASSSRRRQPAASASRAAAEAGAGGASPAPPAQPSPAQPCRLPPHTRAAAAAAVASREGGGRNPAPSTRAPPWTIMIPSRPTTTCSPKRTGTETCSWIRPGRSNRERLAATPQPTAAPFCPPHSRASRLETSSRRARAEAGTSRPPRGGVLGYRHRAEEGSSPCPGACERRSVAARGGGAAGGQVAWVRVVRAAPLLPKPSPRGQGAGAVLPRLGLRLGLHGCLLWIDFPLPSLFPGASIRRAVAARFLGRPWGSPYLKQAATRDSAPPRGSADSGRRGCGRVGRPPRDLPGSGRAGARLGPRKPGAVRGLPRGLVGAGSGR